MSKCPVCDAHIQVIYEGRYESPEHGFDEACKHCDYHHAYANGMHKIRVQTVVYEWLDHCSEDLSQFYACASAIEAARAYLYVV